MSLWETQSWPEIARKLQELPAAILPVGATEQHGPHLGCGVDALLADKLCRSVSSMTGVLMLPSIPYGCSLGHSQHWPGTIALQPKTMIDLIKEVGDWSYISGVRRLFMVNSHVTNAAPLRCALEMLRAEHDDMMVVLLNTADLSKRVKEAHYADGEDWHANDAETSLMMYLAPDIVDKDRIASADDPDRTTGLVFSHPVNRTSKNGVTGKPSIASSDKGEVLFQWMVEDLASLVESGLAELAPLDTSYFAIAEDKG